MSKFEPFPAIRAKPSKIPKCPPMPKKKKGSKAVKIPARPKTSLSGRGSRLSSYGAYPPSGRTSILKNSSLNVRPATSMALTRSATKKVSFGDPMIEPRKSCHSRTTSLDKKKRTTSKKPVEVRPATSTGVRSIPRSASRTSNLSGTRHPAKQQSVEAPARMRRTPSRSSCESYNALYLSTKSAVKSKKAKPQPDPVKKPVKTSVAKASASKKKSHVVKTVKTVHSDVKSAPKGQKSKVPLRPKSAVEMRSGALPTALPFDSPPPVPRKIQSLPIADSGITFPETTRERSTSPLIRSISIIDDEPENDDPLSDLKRVLPRIRIGEGEQPEYKVKAYFLDELEDHQSEPQLNSGVIPSSPVEVDSASARDLEREDTSSALAASVNNPALFITPEPKQVASADCNNTDGMEEIKNRMPEKEPLVFDKDSASVEASGRDHHDDMSLFPEIGMDYLPEFESEVNGLLDTLMSQDLLTSSFSQDFRLFSTESNFMDSFVEMPEATRHPPKRQQQENKTRRSMEDVENIKDCAKPLNAMPQIHELTASRKMEPEMSALEATNKYPHHKSGLQYKISDLAPLYCTEAAIGQTAVAENLILGEQTQEDMEHSTKGTRNAETGNKGCCSSYKSE